MSAPQDVEPGRAAHVLFVCTANRVRSPFAAALATRRCAELGLPIEFRSAGFLDSGRAAVHEMVQAARHHDLDLGAHRSTQLDSELLEWGDVVVTMTGEHALDVVGMRGDLRPRCITIVEWAAATEAGNALADLSPLGVQEWAATVARRGLDVLLSGDLDVPDPVGRPKRAFRRTADVLERLLTTCFEAIDPTAAVPGQPADPMDPSGLRDAPGSSRCRP